MYVCKQKNIFRNNKECNEKENSEFKPVKLRLKIDLVSYPAREEGLVKYDKLKF